MQAWGETFVFRVNRLGISGHELLVHCDALCMHTAYGIVARPGSAMLLHDMPPYLKGVCFMSAINLLLELHKKAYLVTEANSSRSVYGVSCYRSTLGNSFAINRVQVKILIM